ncbi:NAD(P)/FAD-dependent oxidoreductase [Sphingomonas sp. PR090111-T3T-6A]|uniref:NAD(P)/FAD-dependent oxidoreductase n=1 Tax=Sphingomonas sp. PR090111-T3T-6A TaxID=685778 RepID=UPI00035ECEF7|nr:NAD(P)/FAD-dependent oxidoreductase [Sphingomonas sp. PR090111-T3T-6A]
MAQRILIVGAGFAGLWTALGAARVLEENGRADGSIEIALIAPQPELHVRPRLYEAEAGTMKAPLGEVFDAAGVRFVQGTVERIRTGDKAIDYIDAHGEAATLGYDRLVLATGSKLFRPRIPGLADHAFSVDQLDEAAALETHVKALGAQPKSAARNTVVIAGGGFTGIETAAEMPARLREVLGAKAQTRVVVVEQAEAIGPDLGPGPRPVIEQALSELGVEMRLGSGVAAIDADGVTLANGERIDSKTVIWTAGMRASALTEQIPAERDRFGRLHVDRNLRVPGVDGVYATGDTAFAATDDEGNHASMSCQHAMGLGRSSGHNVAADLLGLEPIPYSQPFYVTCLDLGPWGAVYSEGWDRVVKMAGADAKALKHQINSEWIYPPRADRAEIIAAADPRRAVVA